MGASPFPKKAAAAAPAAEPAAAATTAAPAKRPPAKAPAKAAPAKATAGPAVAKGDADPVAAPATGDPFSLPPSTGGSDYKFQEFLGELLLIRPYEVGDMVTKKTKPGERTKYAKVDLYRLENDAELVEGLMVFQQSPQEACAKVLAGPNDWFIGRLIRIPSTTGNSDPYIIDEPTEEEVALVRTFGSENGLW